MWAPGPSLASSPYPEPGREDWLGTRGMLEEEGSPGGLYGEAPPMGGGPFGGGPTRLLLLDSPPGMTGAMPKSAYTSFSTNNTVSSEFLKQF